MEPPEDERYAKEHVPSRDLSVEQRYATSLQHNQQAPRDQAREQVREQAREGEYRAPASTTATAGNSIVSAVPM